MRHDTAPTTGTSVSVPASRLQLALALRLKLKPVQLEVLLQAVWQARWLAALREVSTLPLNAMSARTGGVTVPTADGCACAMPTSAMQMATAAAKCHRVEDALVWFFMI